MSYFDRIRHIAKVTATEYFKDPLYYLFYGLLAAVSAGLIFGAEFSWQLYAVLGTIGALHAWHQTKNTKK